MYSLTVISAPIITNATNFQTPVLSMSKEQHIFAVSKECLKRTRPERQQSSEHL
jgi:hypothetical protein